MTPIEILGTDLLRLCGCEFFSLNDFIITAKIMQQFFQTFFTLLYIIIYKSKEFQENSSIKVKNSVKFSIFYALAAVIIKQKTLGVR